MKYGLGDLAIGRLRTPRLIRVSSVHHGRRGRPVCPCAFVGRFRL